MSKKNLERERERKGGKRMGSFKQDIKTCAI